MAARSTSPSAPDPTSNGAAIPPTLRRPFRRPAATRQGRASSEIPRLASRHPGLRRDGVWRMHATRTSHKPMSAAPGPDHGLIDGAHLVLVDLLDLAVIGEQAVVLALDIGDLRIDAAGHACGNSLLEQYG